MTLHRKMEELLNGYSLKVYNIVRAYRNIRITDDEEATYSVQGTGTGMLRRVDKAMPLNFKVSSDK